jgi:glycosyltransferase involved in cell wall biosynthesis
MIKLMHLINDLDTGGAETMLYKLVSRMDNSRFTNVVISMTDLGKFGGKMINKGIPVYTLGMRRGVPNPIGLLRLLRIVRQEKPLILQTWLYHADLIGLLAGKLIHIPVMWNLRCSNMNMQYYSKLSAIVIKLLRKLSSFPQAVLTNSESGKKLHQKLGFSPRRWVVIPNGFDLDFFHPDPDARKTFREKLGLSQKSILIGLIARFDPMKDHNTFLRAAFSLLKKYEDVHFILVGENINEKNNRLVKLIKSSGKEKNFYLLGQRDDIPYIMAALDIHTISSTFGEGFSNVIGEAMACGIPCVVTNVGDSALIVQETGKVVPPNDPEAVASAWSELIEVGHYERQKLGELARQRIKENFNVSKIVFQYEKVYEEIMAI